jgi:hypothetical protein
MGGMRSPVPALLLFAGVCGGGLLRAQSDAAPDVGQQQAMLARIKQSAMRFEGQLPDFICTKLTARFEDSSGSGKKWKRRDELEETVFFAQNGRTATQLLKLNGKPTNRSHDSIGGIVENGVVRDAIVPASIFGPLANGQFAWSRWGTLNASFNARRTAVFAFMTPRLFKNYPDGTRAYLIGFHGLVYANPEDGMPLRLEVHVDGPEGYPFQESGWDIDYGTVTIAGRELVLPVKAVARYRVNKLLTRNEIQFTGYRKYEADSKVTFDNN